MASFRWVVSTAWILLLGCGGDNTSSNVKSPGETTTAKTKTLAAGADLLQNKAPLRKLSMYLDGFHFYNGDQRGQMEAHHFCSVINEDVTQCIIYDGNGENAKIMGVEYIVSEKLFASLPTDEKKLWHSHVFEVKSGQLIAPGIPELAEHELMEKLVSTYGKTFHTWHTDQDFTLPIGHPMIMMGFTKDGQLNPALVADRNRRFGVSTDAKRKDRATIASPPIQPGADAWQQGDVVQLTLTDSAAPAHNHRAVRQ
ncbi:OBAP family protein [Spirosoma rhododendri]|uniref:OBAP family protein n=1 Tax=Spirosoma rhododendri TaxID=2728024 RepID=A0A7L5DSG0_9BACT|nr:OBAP family protein [Spirosoma rhododendri]QJD78907.1 OBAP family protein [Spirosoma rhododendri]